MSEPPAKRQRQGRAHVDEDEDDGDELFFRPQEVSARRDPGLKLTVRRANAEYKLHARMAHIIEKYSRDFEGVGDEIDMETGEIVVDNGHLSSMRDEGDVGGDWVPEDDEDEGMLLEDLTDEYSDGQEEPGNLDVEPEDDNDESHAQNSDEEEDRIMKGRPIVQATTESSTALVPASMSRPGPPDGKLSALFPNVYSGMFAGPQFGFGASPLAMGPWGLPPGFGAPAWSPPDPRMHHGAPLNPRLLLGANDSPYEFPSQEGFSSIWASGSGYETGLAPRKIRTGVRKQIRKRPSKPVMQSPSKDDTHESQTGDEDEDQEAILTARSAEARGTLEDVMIDDSEEEDDLFPSVAESAPTPRVSSMARMKGKVATKDNPNKETVPQSSPSQCSSPKKSPRKRKRGKSEGSHMEPVRRYSKIREPIEEIDGNRRRSGRARRQTEFLGKISWPEDVERRRSESGFLGLPDFDARTDQRSHHPTPPDSAEESESEWEEMGKTDGPEKIIPNSQDTPTPFTSSAPEATASEETVKQTQAPRRNERESSTLFSDDEAPVLLSKPFRGPEIQTRMVIDEIPQVSDQQNTVHQMANTIYVAEPRKRGRPRKSTPVNVYTKLAFQLVEESSAKGPDTVLDDVPSVTTPVIEMKDVLDNNAYKASANEPRNEMDFALTPSATGSQAPVSVAVDDMDVTSHPPAKNLVEDATETVNEPFQSMASGWEHEPSYIATETEPQEGVELAPMPPRKRGRPRKSISINKVEVTASAHVGESPENKDEAPEVTRRGTRSRKSQDQDAVTSTSPPQDQSPIEAEPSPPLDAQAQDSMNPEVDSTVPDKPRRLKGELKRLMLSPPPGAPPPTAQTEDNSANLNATNEPQAQGRQLRSVKSREALQQDRASLNMSSKPQEAKTATSTDTPQEPTSSRKKPTQQKTSSFTLPPVNKDDPFDLPPDPPRFKPSPRPSPSTPTTPRHTAIPLTHAPSSRRSILSLLSDSDDSDRDELDRAPAPPSSSRRRATTVTKRWHASALTTEVLRTPRVKRVDGAGDVSPGSVVKTPGGTVRTCGVDGYRCGRDFCFTCL